MKRNPLWLIAAVILFGCSEQLSEVLVSPGSLPINLTGSINQQNLTRANEQGFVSGDRMGIYIVDYVDGQPGKISTDNRASNVIYTFDGDNYRWTAPTTIYWRDKETPVDVYGYYPAANYISDPSAFHFEVNADQNVQREGEMGSYEASDFLWGKTAGTAPTTETIMVRYSHRLAGVRVQLLKGEGLTDTEWQKLPRLVTVDNTVRTATIDLATGTAAPSGSYDRPIRMLEQSGDYRAVVIPQTVEAGKALISITIDGIAYSHKLTSPMKYQAGKLHNFSITVNKSEASGDYSISVSDDGITDWINDEASHQFSSMQYVIVHCDKYGTLKDCITRAGFDYQTIQNLKITGELTEIDFTLLRDEMPELRHLNLNDAKIKHICYYDGWWDYGSHDHDLYCDDVLPDYAFNNNQYIRSIILPANLKRIGICALSGIQLMYSTLEIPEGVSYISDWACSNTEYNGVEIILPSTLDSIAEHAFGGCGYKCELKLSDNITYIGRGAFSSTPNFYGTFHIPSKLKQLDGAFSGLGSDGSFVGEIEIPEGLNYVAGLSVGLKNYVEITIPAGVKKLGSGWPKRICNIHFNDDLEEIDGDEVFRWHSLPFQLKLPPSLRKVSPHAFGSCGIEGELVIPENCLDIGCGAFGFNQLTKITLPSKLEYIDAETFEANNLLTSITIPKYVNEIGQRAFAYCDGLQTVICLSPEPPAMEANAFDGLYFDKVILEVPEASVELYRQDEKWKIFKNITPHHELAYNVPEIVCMDKGTTRSGILRAEGEWEVSECPSWVTVSPSSGEYKEEVTVTVQPNTGDTREGKIVFSLKGKNYTTYTDIRQVNLGIREDATVTLQTASAGGKPIPIFIVGEGYNADDIASGQYLADMKEQMDYLFSTEPYKSYRNYFTVSTAYACSPESGINGKMKFQPENPWENCNDYVWKYAQQHGTDINDHATILILYNSSAYGWHTDLWDNGTSFSWLGKNTDIYPYDQRGDVLHYLGGRGFGKLGPEYVGHFTIMKACTCPGCNMTNEFNRMREKGWWQNVSITSKMTELPWYPFIFHEKYAQMVDVYEGALNHARGAYRSENQSVMGSAHVYYFNTISRYEIVRRIMEEAGMSFSLEQFIANDKIEIPEE